MMLRDDLIEVYKIMMVIDRIESKSTFPRAGESDPEGMSFR